MKPIYQIIFFSFLSLHLCSQGKHVDKQPHFGKARCDNYEGYIPYKKELMPLQRVRVVIHIFQKDDGSGNLHNTTKELEFISMMVHHCNAAMSELDTMRPYPHRQVKRVPSARVEFVVDTILFHRDTRAWNFRKECNYYDEVKKDSVMDEGKAYTHAEGLYIKYVRNNTELQGRQKDSAINVFFLEDGKLNGRGMTSNRFSKRWIYILGSWKSFNEAGKPNHWTNGLTMAHEFGHAMGLTHPFEGSDCKDLPRTPRGSTSNLMDYYPGESNALTPCQVGTIQMALAGHEGDISQALIKDWCTYHPNETMNIPAGDTVYFDGDRKLTGDLVIKKGAVLILKCKLSMPTGGSIIIWPCGAFIIDGGLVYNACGDKWNAVYMEKREPFLGFKRKSRSLFQTFNDGRFINSENGIIKVTFQPRLGPLPNPAF